MTANKHTPFLTNEQVKALNEKHGWFKHGDAQSDVSRAFANDAVAVYERVRNAAPEMMEALHEGRRAIGDHNAPNDCYATGPLTGNHYRDLVECPACSFIAMYDAAIAKAGGAA